MTHPTADLRIAAQIKRIWMYSLHFYTQAVCSLMGGRTAFSQTGCKKIHNVLDILGII